MRPASSKSETKVRKPSLKFQQLRHTALRRESQHCPEVASPSRTAATGALVSRGGELA